MSTKPRTPEHFPHMKHRAAGRPYRQFGSAIKRLSKTLKGAEREFRKLGHLAYAVGENFNNLKSMVDCGCDPEESVLDSQHDADNSRTGP